MAVGNFGKYSNNLGFLLGHELAESETVEPFQGTLYPVRYVARSGSMLSTNRELMNSSPSHEPADLEKSKSIKSKVFYSVLEDPSIAGEVHCFGNHYKPEASFPPRDLFRILLRSECRVIGADDQFVEFSPAKGYQTKLAVH